MSAIDTRPLTPRPSAVAGRCLDIDGFFWHQPGTQCEFCGYGINFAAVDGAPTQVITIACLYCSPGSWGPCALHR